MINQFSEHVRRNQKQWMVVITILAVFSFVFDDMIRGAGKASGGTVVFVAVFCAAGMSIIGYKRGKTTEFGIAGLVVGALVAFVGLRSAGPPVVVRTSVGNFTRSDLTLLKQRRQRADQFVRAAVKKIDKTRSAPGFGNLDDHSMVMFALLHKEAGRMGVSVTDESVNQYLSQVTEDKLSAKDYNDTLRDVGLSEGELFDIVRGELEVQLVAQLISAPADAHPTMAQFTRGMYSGRIARQTPEQLWQSFRKLHVRQALTTVALPVTDFVKLVPEPSESELRVFFDKHKNGYGDERGTPGFLEPPKVRLAYLAVSNLEAYEKQVPEITDQDVVDYYLANKESFRVNEIPSPSGPKLPDLMQDPTSDDSAPADATQAENSDKGKDAVPSADAAPEAKDDEKPATPEKPAAPDKPDAAPAKEETPCGGEPSADKPASDTKDVAPDAEAAKKAVESPADSENKSPPAPALPSDEAPADATTPHSGADSSAPALNSLPLPPPVAKYRELDDDLKEQIREIILRDKGFHKMGEAAEKALETMMELSLKYSAMNAKEREAAAGAFATGLKSYAEKNGLEYNETKEMTQFDLMNPSNDPIGNATDPVVGANFSRAQVSVAEEAFSLEASGRGYRLPIFSPRRADTRSSRYSYWKTLEVPAKVPDFKDAVVRQKVLDAYKFEKAGPLAEKRAKDLADLMRKGEADIAAALSGQTINGTTDSPATTIRETPRFSWLRLPQSLPQFGLQRPVESTIEGIGQPGFQFMKTVFDELGNGDTGVTVNSSRTVYYAVRVHDRDGSGAEGNGIATLESLQAQFSRERFSNFLPTPYEFLGAEIQQIVDNRWRADFSKRLGIKFENEAAGEADEE
ncbi:MAG: hypothetical protein AABP62_23105 [Planctomycetota bacterium]